MPFETALPGGRSGWLIRPRPASRVWTGIAVIGAFVGLRALFAARSPHAIEADLMVFAPLVAMGLIALGLYLLNARVIIDRETITWINPLGRRKTWPKDAVDRVDRFRTPGGYGARYAVFVGKHGKKLFSLSSPYWDLNRVIDVCRHLRIHLAGSYEDLVSPYRLNSRVPGMTTWWSWALGFGLVAVIVASAIVSVLVFGSPSAG